MRYSNLDLWIGHPNSDGHYPTRASTERLGEAPDDWMVLDLKAVEFAGPLHAVNSGDAGRDDLVQLGKRLYLALFRSGSGQVERLFERCVGRVQGKGDAIRIRLRIDDPEMAALPWEFLYSPEKEQFLAASIDTVLVRYLEMPTPVRDLETGFPLRLLVVIPGGSGLDTEKEKTQLMRALAPLESRVEPVWLEDGVSIGDIDDALCAHPYHLVHFIGHGEFAESGACVFLNGPGEPDTQVAIDEQRFAQLFGNHRSIKLVVLNACEGAAVSQVKPLVGVAPQLVRRGVPAVVAMQFSIYDEVAIAFSHSFYSNLLNGYQAGRIDVAMAQARNRLVLSFPGERDIGAPVLFMRAPQGVLFSQPPTWLDKIRTPKGKRDHENAQIGTIIDNARSYRNQGQDQKAENELNELSQFKRKLRYRRLSNVAAAFAALLVITLGWTKALDFPFGLQSQVEELTLLLGGLIRANHLDPKIAMIGIDDATRVAIDPIAETYPLRRSTHGKLVAALQKAGAKAMIFDLYFVAHAETPAEETAIFAAALRAASSDDRKVITGNHDVQKLDETLVSAASGVGSLKILGPGKLVLGIVRDGQLAEPALSLLAAAAERGESVNDLRWDVEKLYLGEHSFMMGSTKFTYTEAREKEAKDSKSVFHELHLTVPINTPALIPNSSQYHSYQKVVHMKPHELEQHFKDKLVVIGDLVPKTEKKPIAGTFAWRYGMEIHASALSTLISGQTVKKPFYKGELTMALFLVGLGVYLGWRLAPCAPKCRRWCTFAIISVYFAGTLLSYGLFNYLLDPLTGVIVLWIAVRVGEYSANLLKQTEPEKSP